MLNSNDFNFNIFYKKDIDINLRNNIRKIIANIKKKKNTKEKKIHNVTNNNNNNNNNINNKQKKFIISCIFLFFLFFFISMDIVFAQEYVSVGNSDEYYYCLFNNTKINIDVNSDGLEDYILECNENQRSEFVINPRNWQDGYIIKTNKPIIYYYKRIINIHTAAKDYFILDYFEYSSQFEKNYLKNILNIYEKGDYIFFDNKTEQIKCLNYTKINISYNKNKINIPCDFYYNGVINGISYDKTEVNSGHYFYISENRNLYFIGHSLIYLDFNSDGIIDDSFFINNTKLNIPANTTIKSKNKIMIRRSDNDGFIGYRNYYQSFGSLNSTYFSSVPIYNFFNQSQKLYLIENKVYLNRKEITKKMNLDVTLFPKFKSYTDKSIEIIISNPTFKRVNYHFYYAISQNTRLITETVRSLYDDENLEFNELFLEPFTYRKITIDLQNSFSLLNLDYGISFDEVYYAN